MSYPSKRASVSSANNTIHSTTDRQTSPTMLRRCCVSASRYGIRGIPNLIILKDGAVKEQIVGAVPKARLVAAIDKAIAA